jgi:multicomponent Na+:H+ antiporter subunit E
VKSVVWVLLLAIAWTAVNGSFSGPQLMVGIGLGTLVMLFVRAEGADVLRKVKMSVGLLAFFFWELFVANLRVARDVLSPRVHYTPGVIAVPLDLRGDVPIAMLANLLTLTPGTLSLDVSRDRTVLYVHGMWVADPDEARRDTKEGFERRIKDLFS